jgi:LPS-assembly lipoprotein
MSCAERRGVLLALGAAAAAALTACGFQLRQTPRMPFASIALAGFAPRSALATEFKRQLEPQLPVLDSADKAEVVLQALVESRERSVAGSTAAAQVRELQLRLKFSFRATARGGRELIPRADLLVVRGLSFNETAALAKEGEEAELYRDMIDDAVGQVLRRLATVKL